MSEIKAVKVQYTVKEEYVEKNKEMIAAVMKDLREKNNPNIQYSSFLLEDGKSFMHIVIRKGETDLPGSLESFKKFQAGLKENLEVPPKSENFSLVNSSFDY